MSSLPLIACSPIRCPVSVAVASPHWMPVSFTLTTNYARAAFSHRSLSVPYVTYLLALVDHDCPTLHHPPNAVDHDVDVGEGIAFNGNDIGEVAGRDPAEGAPHAEDRGAVRRRRGERLRRRHADLSVPAKLARVLPEHMKHRV